MKNKTKWLLSKVILLLHYHHSKKSSWNLIQMLFELIIQVFLPHPLRLINIIISFKFLWFLMKMYKIFTTELKKRLEKENHFFLIKQKMPIMANGANSLASDGVEWSNGKHDISIWENVYSSGILIRMIRISVTHV